MRTRTRTRPGWTWWRASQLGLGLWLLVAPLVYPPGASTEVVLKDLAIGTVLGLTTLAAAAGVCRAELERRVCAVLGGLLLLAVLLLDDGVGTGAILARWNELVVGVLLICLACVGDRS